MFFFNSQLFLFSFDLGGIPTINVNERRYYSLKALVHSIPNLLMPENLNFYIQVINFFYTGFEFEIIENESNLAPYIRGQHCIFYAYHHHLNKVYRVSSNYPFNLHPFQIKYELVE